eukprot:6030933-Pyramimonas_sp.AAC.1
MPGFAKKEGHRNLGSCERPQDPVAASWANPLDSRCLGASVLHVCATFKVPLPRRATGLESARTN